MGLFGVLIKTAINVMETPFAIAKDVATLGGTLTDKQRPYISEKLSDLEDSVEGIKREAEKL